MKTLTHRKIASRGGTNTKKRHPEHFSQAGHKSWNARAAKNPNAGNELATKGLVARRYKKATQQLSEFLSAYEYKLSELSPFQMAIYDDALAGLFSGEMEPEDLINHFPFVAEKKVQPKKSFVNSLLGRKTT